MTSEEIIRLVFSFLGGGLVAGLLDWFRAHRSEKKALKVSAMQAQIQNLYGPLQFFASQNESYFELNKKFMEAYEAEYVGKKWSQDETTQKNLEQETEQTLEIANTYVRMVTKNNESILEALRNNYAYIDTDDVEVFRQLVVDYTRLKTEFGESGRLNTPLRIYKHIGSISFMRPEFSKRVKEKFNAKKKELDFLMS
ncbi:MAG: hypothetical protein KAX39_01310 [candidate division Zixibacteria bacterium]|nr:hypothetical protein [candidate division Zixibacteria bacterium]